MRILCSVLILFCVTQLSAQFSFASPQQAENPIPLDSLTFSERLVYGGFGGLNAGSGFFFLQLNPQVGYQKTDEFTLGVNGNIYFWQNRFQEYRYSAFGPSGFARYRLLNILFVQSELELLYIKRKFNLYRDSEITTQEFVPGILVGGGVVLHSGGKSFSSVSVMFNLIDGNDRPYRNPQLRFGFHYGF